VRGIWRVFTILPILGLCVACVGRFEYVRPVASEAATNWLAVAKSTEEVWRQAVSTLDKNDFVIDGLNKDSGVITFSYRGDPERYVDCGYITSYVKNLRGERRYGFPAATASTEYEFMTGREILLIARTMTLDGRVTVTVTALSARETRISANARYALTRILLVRDTQGRSESISQHIDFDSGQEGVFPGAILCVPNGRLEREALSAFAR